MEGENTPAQGAGEGETAPGQSAVELHDGAPVDDGQSGGEGQNDGQQNDGGEGGEEELDDWGNPRTAKVRFTKLTSQNQELKERLARLEGRIEERQTQQQPVQQEQQQTNPDPEPNHENFAGGKYDPDYILERARWEGRQERRAEREAMTRQEAVRQEQEGRKERFLGVVDRAGKNEDTPNAEAALVDILTSQKNAGAHARGVALVDLICESEHPELIAQHLHGNSKLRDELLGHIDAKGVVTKSGLAAIARKLGQLDTTLPGTFQARKKTRAGEPPENLGGGGAANSPGYRRNMSSEDYRAARKAGVIQ
jgi:hypothetical protein